MAINCCYGCVPPKRTPTCKFDGTCNKYSEAKEKHDALKAEYDRKKAIESSVLSQRSEGIYKATKHRRKGL